MNAVLERPLLSPSETVLIGGEPKGVFFDRLRYHRIAIDRCLDMFLHSDQFTTPLEPVAVRVVQTEVSCLGFSKPVSTIKLQDRIVQIGHALCPVEAVLRRLLAQDENSYGHEVCWFVTERFLNARGEKCIPELFREGIDRGVIARKVPDDYLWSPCGTIAFQFCD